MSRCSCLLLDPGPQLIRFTNGVLRLAEGVREKQRPLPDGHDVSRKRLRRLALAELSKLRREPGEGRVEELQSGLRQRSALFAQLGGQRSKRAAALRRELAHADDHLDE